MNWINIKNHMPPKDTQVLTFAPEIINKAFQYEVHTCMMYNNQLELIGYDSDGNIYPVTDYITHWMFIPEIDEKESTCDKILEQLKKINNILEKISEKLEDNLCHDCFNDSMFTHIKTDKCALIQKKINEHRSSSSSQ